MSSRWTAWASYLLILLAWPVLAVLRAPSDPAEFVFLIQADKLGTYLASGLFLWFVFVVIWLAQRLERQGITSLGLTRLNWRHLGWGIAFLIGANIALNVLGLILKAFGMEIPELILEALLPETGIEKSTWIGLSISAGVCEEMCFRGFLLVRGELLMRSRWPAVLLASAAFGIGHYYQGWGGVILIFSYGLFFTWLRLRTGSLWPCIIAHSLQDIAAMVILPLQNSW